MRLVVLALLLVSTSARADGSAEFSGGFVTRVGDIGTGGAATVGFGWYANERLAIGPRAALFVRDGEAHWRLAVGPAAQLWLDKRVFVTASLGYANIGTQDRHGSLRTLHTVDGGLRAGVTFGSLTLGIETHYTPYAETTARCFPTNAGGVIVAALVGYQRR